jgi:hypothetical protein
MFFLLSFMFFLQQNWRTRGWQRGKVAQIMYTHVSKCKSDKIFFFKKKDQLIENSGEMGD